MMGGEDKRPSSPRCARLRCFSFAAAASLALAVAAYGAGPVETPVSRHEFTNVIMISLQCLRPDHLGAYGYQRETSPNIDRLARSSALFENAIAQANLTPVAQLSVLTSEYPRVHGMVSFEVSRDAMTQRTLPEILKYYGYTTAAAVSSPEFYLRFDAESGAVVNPGDVFSRSFDTYERSLGSPGGHGLRRLPTEALQWIKDNKDKKFFLWIASGLLHMPYGASAPSPYKTMFDPPNYIPFWKRVPGLVGPISGEKDPSYEIFSRVHQGDFFWGFSPVYRLTETDRQFVQARYDAGVYYTDRFIGELTALLDSLRLTGKTLVVLHSIHGDELGERGNYFHYDVNDKVVKTALIMRFPGEEFAGERIAGQVQGIDIMPTVLDYLGIPASQEAQGASLLPLLRGDAAYVPQEFAYIERTPWWEFNISKWYLDFQDARGTAAFPPSEKNKLDAYRALLKESFSGLEQPPGDIAIRSDAWKLILRKNATLLRKVSWWNFISGRNMPVEEAELYDLKNDPLEIKNVYGEHPEIVARLKARLLAWDEAMERQKARYAKKEKRWIIPYP
jgi:arylsulfatase A-like enzyme